MVGLLEADMLSHSASGQVTLIFISARNVIYTCCVGVIFFPLIFFPLSFFLFCPSDIYVFCLILLSVVLIRSRVSFISIQASCWEPEIKWAETKRRKRERQKRHEVKSRGTRSGPQQNLSEPSCETSSHSGSQNKTESNTTEVDQVWRFKERSQVTVYKTKTRAKWEGRVRVCFNPPMVLGFFHWSNWLGMQVFYSLSMPRQKPCPVFVLEDEQRDVFMDLWESAPVRPVVWHHRSRTSPLSNYSVQNKCTVFFFPSTDWQSK